MNSNVIPQDYAVTRKDRIGITGHLPAVLWFTGLSGSGKSTLADRLQKLLVSEGRMAYVLDGDNTRLGINKDLDFSPGGRKENIRRVAEIAKILADAGIIVITGFISPYRADREMAKEIIGEKDFREIHVDCPLEVCEKRDVKGLYKKARKGEIPDFTGISSPYETPENPFLKVNTGEKDLESCLIQIHNSITDLLK